MDGWLTRAAARRPDRIALVTQEEAVSYRELLLRAVRAAGALHERSARRVAIALEPGAAFVEVLHGALLLGIPVTPVDPRLRDRERAHVLRDADAVVERRPGGGASAFALPPMPAQRATALAVHTSGTTGRPTRVELSYAAVERNTQGVRAALDLSDDERWLCPLPLSHVGGLMCVLRSAIMATTVVLGPLAATSEPGVTVASLVPTQLLRLLDAGARPGPDLRRILLGGGPMPRALLERARDAGFPVSPSYGLTQACSAVTIAEPGDVETAGRAIPGTGVAIAQDGEILVSTGDGTLRTGDLGRLEPDGRLVVLGRKGDLIVTGGENVAPAEVEAVLAAHPDVLEAAVLGRTDPEWGEAVTALVVPRLGAHVDPQELRRFCAERLAPFKVPKTVELVAALPRTGSGKVRRADLR